MTEPKWWDATIKKCEISEQMLKSALESIKADKFVWGTEHGLETGYEHYQLRVVFKKPTSMDKLISFNKAWGLTAHWSPSHVHDFDYCEKEGQYYRSWEGALAKYRDMKLRPWQGSLVADLMEQSDREVTVVVDELGNQGKSWLAKHLVVRYGYAYVPAMPNFEDYMFMAMAHAGAKGFIFDLPRADTLQQKKAMWMAMETIKNGYIYDKRYTFKEMWIEPPKMVVFANENPPFEVLSKDRWRAYYLTDTWGETMLQEVNA